MSELKNCPFCGAKAEGKHISARCSRKCVDWTYREVWNTREPHPAIKEAYQKFVIDKHPANLTGDDMFAMLQAIKKAVENE